MDDLFSLGGWSLWETDVERPDPRGIPLAGSRYCRPDYSVHPGLTRQGDDEAYTDGVEELPEQQDVFDLCGGEGWDSLVVYSPHVLTGTGPDGSLLLRGGVVVGGRHLMARACLIPYGSCIHLRGGVVAGGRMAMRGSGQLTLRGGVVEGGVLDLGSQGIYPKGGAVAGGRLSMVGGATFTLRGGAVAGGRGATGAPSGLALRGGVVTGGRLFPMGGSDLVLRGGAVAGGRLTMTGGADCGPVPTVVGARSRPHRLSMDEIAFPAGTAPGDTLLLIGYQALEPAFWAVPFGWTLLGGDSSPDHLATLSMWYKVWDGGGTAGVLVSGQIGVQMQLSIVALRNTGLPVVAGFAKDVTNVQQVVNYNVGDCPVVLIAAACLRDYDNDYNTFTGMSDLTPVPAKTPLAVWSRVPAGPGSEGGYVVTPDSPGPWVTALVVFPPE